MSFKLSVDKFIEKSAVATLAVVQDAAQEMAIDANTPVAKGGRLRVDTGFLRNSIAARVGSLPQGPNLKPDGYSKPSWDSSAVTSVIMSMELGQKLYIGWSAEYAIYRENQDGFARLAAMSWPQYVAKATAKIKALL